MGCRNSKSAGAVHPSPREGWGDENAANKRQINNNNNHNNIITNKMLGWKKNGDKPHKIQISNPSDFRVTEVGTPNELRLAAQRDGLLTRPAGPTPTSSSSPTHTMIPMIPGLSPDIGQVAPGSVSPQLPSPVFRIPPPPRLPPLNNNMARIETPRIQTPTRQRSPLVPILPGIPFGNEAPVIITHDGAKPGVQLMPKVDPINLVGEVIQSMDSFMSSKSGSAHSMQLPLYIQEPIVNQDQKWSESSSANEPVPTMGVIDPPTSSIASPPLSPPSSLTYASSSSKNANFTMSIPSSSIPNDLNPSTPDASPAAIVPGKPIRHASIRPNGLTRAQSLQTAGIEIPLEVKFS